MVLDKLGASLRGALAKLTNASYVDEKLINEVVKDLQRSLLQADVNVKLVFALSGAIKERAKEKPAPGLTVKEHIVNIMYEELTNFLGKEHIPIDFETKPLQIMLVGLFGNGKTTTAGKLAKYYKTRGKKVALISTDTWRPAAFEQLKQLGAQIDIPVYGNPDDSDPVRVYKQARKEIEDVDLIIVDTAGRDALNDELVEEIDALNKEVKPEEKLLVLAADLGQSAQKQAQMFHDTVHVTGVVITKLDGTAKGGGALSACAVTGSAVKFIGVGEKIDALEEFKPKNFVGRLLGMGDLEALLEKAKLAMSEDQAQDLTKKFMSGNFTLQDMFDQISAVKKMGSFSKLMKMIPGMSQANIPKEMLDAQESSLEKWGHIMTSMTKQEKLEPEILNGSRVERISMGSGQSEKEVRSMLKHYRKSKKMMRMFKGKMNEKSMQKMMKKMGGSPKMKF